LQAGQHITNHLNNLNKQFAQSSTCPNEELRALLDYVMTSYFFVEERLEPALDHPEAKEILDAVRKKLSTNTTISLNIDKFLACNGADDMRRNRSIYTHFANRKSGCLFSIWNEDDSVKRCPFKATRESRYIDHARTHIGHRPYPCTGAANCEICGAQ
jgi:hypothetical protein